MESSSSSSTTTTQSKSVSKHDQKTHSPQPTTTKAYCLALNRLTKDISDALHLLQSEACFRRLRSSRKMSRDTVNALDDALKGLMRVLKGGMEVMKAHSCYTDLWGEADGRHDERVEDKEGNDDDCAMSAHAPLKKRWGDIKL